MKKLNEICNIECVNDRANENTPFAYKPSEDDCGLVIVHKDYVDVIMFLNEQDRAEDLLDDWRGNIYCNDDYDDEAYQGLMYYGQAKKYLSFLNFYRAESEKKRVRTSFSEFSYDFGGWYRERWIKKPEYQEYEVKAYSLAGSCYPSKES